MGRKTKKQVHSEVTERLPVGGVEQILAEEEMDQTEETIRLRTENAELKERDQKMVTKIEDVLIALREARLTIVELTEQQQELQRQIDAKEQFIQSLVAVRQRDQQTHRLSQKVVTLQKMTDSGLEDELKRIKEDRKRLLDELEKTKFDLKQVLQSDEGREYDTKIRLLEIKVSELETEKEQVELEGGEKFREVEEKSEAIAKKEMDWQLRYEKALSNLKNSQSTLQETKDAYSLIEKSLEYVKIDNDRLGKELDSLRETTHPVTIPIESVEIPPSETRVTIDEDTKEFQIICPILMRSHPVALRCKSALEKFYNTHFVKEGVPITQLLFKKIRAAWGRRPFRPYFRVMLIVYVTIVNLLLFSYWLE